MVKLYSIEIPSSFYEEEVRCDYLVSKKRKEVWAVELDLLARLQNVCESNNLAYYADWGTLLGAIRHNGFIPWDDDIDVVMPRKDYQKLCEIANKEFVYPYFFQTEYTDEGSVRGHAQLRNSETTAFLKHEYLNKCRFNQGMFIDIFPLDNIPPVNERDNFWQNLKKLYNKSQIHAKNDLKKGVITHNLDYSEFEKCVQQYNEFPDIKLFGSLSFSFDDPKGFRRIMDFETWEMMPFENIMIRVPCGYKNILRTCYGIWKEIVKEGSIHGEVYFDTTKSYKEYLKADGLIHETMRL